MKSLIPMERIKHRIFVIRGHKVILDADLANLYGVSTKAFNQAVKRNKRRFPPDFMFRLSVSESSRMRSQSVTASKRNIRYAPLCFTEQGIAMLSGVLNSARAVAVNIMIMRAFVKLREIISANKDLAAWLDKLESRYDTQFKAVFEAIRELISAPEKPRKRIGFTAK
jgi:hypothetical protein